MDCGADRQLVTQTQSKHSGTDDTDGMDDGLQHRHTARVAVDREERPQALTGHRGQHFCGFCWGMFEDQAAGGGL